MIQIYLTISQTYLIGPRLTVIHYCKVLQLKDKLLVVKQILLYMELFPEINQLYDGLQ